MPQSLAQVTFLVRDYEEALVFFIDTLGFRRVEDSALPDGSRWVVVTPPGSAGSNLLLARAEAPEELELIGKQAGGRVFLFLQTDDFWRDHRLMKAAEVKFLEPPREESYATVAVFEDLYGNKWDLLQPKEADTLRPQPLVKESR